jgi:hypothetical protein
MGADDGVLGLREHLALVLHPVAAAIDVLAAMDGGHPLEEALHRLGQRLVGRVHAGEQSVAAHRGQLLQVEDAPHGGLGVAGHVRVPVLAGHMLGVLVGVDDEDLGMALHEAGRGGMHGEVAEEPAEGLLGFGRQALVPEEDDRVLDEGVVHLLVGRLV